MRQPGSELWEPRCRSCRLLDQRGRCRTFRASNRGLAHADAGNQDQADGSHDDELHRVPQAQEDEEVEPSGSVVCDEGREGTRRQEVGHGEEHGGDAPFQSSAGADGVEEDVAGHVAAQECAGVDAEGPELTDHDGVSSHMRDGSSEAVRV